LRPQRPQHLDDADARRGRRLHEVHGVTEHGLRGRIDQARAPVARSQCLPQ
jgi:hypothetical protein